MSLPPLPLQSDVIKTARGLFAEPWVRWLSAVHARVNAFISETTGLPAIPTNAEPGWVLQLDSSLSPIWGPNTSSGVPTGAVTIGSDYVTVGGEYVTVT